MIIIVLALVLNVVFSLICTIIQIYKWIRSKRAAKEAKAMETTTVVPIGKEESDNYFHEISFRDTYSI